MAEYSSDIPSQQPNTGLSVAVSCLQQSGTGCYSEAAACSSQLQHKKKCSENMLGKENLMMKKQLQAVEEFNIASENRMSCRAFSQTNCWCEPKINARKSKQHNIITADGMEGTSK